jgi:hypothetical protein
VRLTLTEDLIMEVLAARHRLGENIWPFDSALRPRLRALAGLGLIGYKGGIVEGTCNAWMTDEGRRRFLDPTYTPPTPNDQ